MNFILLIILCTTFTSLHAQLPLDLKAVVWSDFPVCCKLDHVSRMIPDHCYDNLSIDSSSAIEISLRKNGSINNISVRFYKITALLHFEFVVMHVRVSNPVELNVNNQYVYRIKGFQLYDGHHFLDGLLPILCDKRFHKEVLDQIAQVQPYLNSSDWALMLQAQKKNIPVFTSNNDQYSMLFSDSTWPKATYKNQSFNDKTSLSKLPLYCY